VVVRIIMVVQRSAREDFLLVVEGCGGKKIFQEE
jgi:hypothetical protein